MKMTDLLTNNDAEPVIFTNKDGPLVVTEEGLIWNFAVLRRKIYFLYPGGHPEVTLLRESTIDAGYTSDQKKKNQVNPV